jgi:regulator of cell morphogenesis and NO signaling
MATSTQSIREIISTQASAAAVLERFDIDLCAHANESLNQACAGLQLSIDQVLEKLADAAANEHGAAPADPTAYSLGRLIQHIVRTHHQYVRRELPRLVQIAQKVTGRHSQRAPELKQVEELIGQLGREMVAHFAKEEQVLFPFVAQMEQNVAVSCAAPEACFRTVAQPIAMMITEHESAEGIVADIRDLTHGFTPPAWACASYVALYAGLREFAADLRQHVHLENDVLFPRAIELEAKLNRWG